MPLLAPCSSNSLPSPLPRPSACASRTFTHPSCTIPKRFPNSFDTAVALQKKHDPKLVFEPDLWTKIREGKPYTLFPGCALNKECYCEEDIHCPQYHRCISSRAPGLSSFKVCKPDWRLHRESGRDPENNK